MAFDSFGKGQEKHNSVMSFWSWDTRGRGPLDGAGSALAVSRKAAPRYFRLRRLERRRKSQACKS